MSGQRTLLFLEGRSPPLELGLRFVRSDMATEGRNECAVLCEGLEARKRLCYRKYCGLFGLTLCENVKLDARKSMRNGNNARWVGSRGVKRKVR